MKILNSYNIISLFSVLIFFLFSGIKIRAQAPGGTSYTIEVWLSADKLTGDGNPLPLQGHNVVKWSSVIPGGRDYIQNTISTTSSSQAVPTFKRSGDLMNYQPALSFSTRQAKLINTNLLPLTSKSFYVFYVSEVGSTSTSVNTVFSFISGGTRGQTTRNNLVGWYGGNPSFTFGGTATSDRRTHQGNGLQYGINTTIIPNTASLIPSSYLNGVVNSTPFNSGTLSLPTNPLTSIIGSVSTESATNEFDGNIEELIILSAPLGTNIDATELQKINTYLAVKYGLTISGDFILKDNSIIWEKGRYGNYDGDVFGVGRDDASSIYQKQSRSQTSKLVSVFYGSNILDLNVDNQSNITDGEFVMLGTDLQDGVTDYLYPMGTTYSNGESLTDVSKSLKNTMLRAQVRGTTSATVNLLLSFASGYVVVSQDSNFLPADTRLYRVDHDGIAHGVELGEGDYIGFVLVDIGPGGVSDGLKLWLRADDSSSIGLSGSNVLEWKDQTYLANDYTYADVNYSGKTYPQYLTCDNRMNFHPAIQFDVTSYLARTIGPMSSDTPSDFTSFVSYYATAYASDVRLYTHGFGSNNPRASTSRYPAMGFAPGDQVGRLRNDGVGETDVDGTLPGFRRNTTALQMINTHSAGSVNGSGYAIHDFGGWQDTRVATGAFGTGFRMASGGTLGGASITSGSFQGLISEVFFYERSLSQVEQNKIRTYLGMKYAITLDEDKNNINLNYDYILSDGTVVWKGNSEPNKYFHNNVAGLVHDKGSNMFINKARSSASGAVVTMMISGHSECGQGAESLLSNPYSGLFWGNNNDPTLVTITSDECFEFTDILAKTWLVQKSNLDGNLDVVIRLGRDVESDLNQYINSGYQAYLLIADNASDIVNKSWNQAIPSSFIDGEHEFKYTFEDDGQEYKYFSFAFKFVGAQCETCDFRGEDYLAFDRSNMGRSIIVSSPAAPKIYSAHTKNGNLTMNLTMAITSGVTRMQIIPPANGSTRPVNLRSSGAANAISRIIYDLDQPADVSFAIGDIDQYETVQVYGYCSGVQVYPTYVYPAAGSGVNVVHTFTIDKTYAKVTGNGMQSAGRNNLRGKVFFEFGVSVEQIVIEFSNIRSGARWLDLYPMSFSCPQPLPLPNEAGYAFQKRGNDIANVCDLIDYSFIIMNSNGNCDTSRVAFKDVLPDGMFWVPNSLSFDDSLLDRTAVPAGEENIIINGRTLEIRGILPGNGSRVPLRAQAAFEDDAPVGMTYYNQAEITYKRRDNGIEETLESTDAYYISGTDKRTATEVLNAPRDFKYVNTSMALRPSACYKENNEILVTLTIDNPNPISISNMFLEVYYNENFHLVPGSLKINGATPGSGVDISIEVYDDGAGGTEACPGMSFIENFTLASNSQTTLSYIIKAPALGDLTIIDTVDGQNIYEIMGLGYSLDTDMSGSSCLENAFLNAFEDDELPYCTNSSSKSYIISNKNVTSKIRR
ncbi:hypothetical protein [Dysgonomonas sp. GY617]|uniref:hypothetical protein n=1 Tax=Dysgonomonas sp. GY617 TaxID=2780420 RepID=UPI0018837464|nr:hypothetical protein [Dysgonomonas sp. GY617]MBF0577151.1 hypothetical protein [Dysgonomonas sp. GY617]